MKILLLACVLVSSAAAAATGSGPAQQNDSAAQTNPSIHEHAAVIFIGKHDGEILRCNQENPNDCEVFHVGETPIYSLLVSGEYVYAGLSNGVILKCKLNAKNSCEDFYSGSTEVWSLLTTQGYLYAGLVDGIILRCDLQKPSCIQFYNITYSVNSLSEKDHILVAGLASGDVFGCLAGTPNNCRDLFEADAGVSGIANLKDNTYVLTNEGQLLKCSRIEGPGGKNCVNVDSKIKNGSLWDLRAFNGSLYVYGDDIGICKWVNEDSCESFSNASSAWRFDMAYGTHALQDEYKTEHTNCKQGEECQLVSYFNEHERVEFEVYFDRYLRYRSNYTMVDTRDADQGHSGPAALFVMAPDGKLYLSKHHQGSIHTSSFLAGNPVSGAGEIVVEHGVIKKIVACSKHYKPDLELNKQVIDSLRTSGYTQPIVSESCH